jgi:hypothetical protein
VICSSISSSSSSRICLLLRQKLMKQQFKPCFIISPVTARKSKPFTHGEGVYNEGSRNTLSRETPALQKSSLFVKMVVEHMNGLTGDIVST